MQFEEEFGIEIPDEDAENLLSVGQAIEYISNKLNVFSDEIILIISKELFR